MIRFLKIFILALISLSLAFLVYLYFLFEPTKDPGWGLSFSRTHAEYLGYDWKEMYLDMLNELGPKKLRLISYWELMEKENDLWYFQDIEEMLLETQKRNIDVVLTVGHKVPRWPECHHPAWYNLLTDEEKKSEQLEMVEMAVNRFKKYDSIKYWQVENEPLFGFGYECPEADKQLLAQEIDLVRSLDQRPIILADSGELGRWVPTASFKPDIFGTTMYRTVHNPKVGYFRYPIPPIFFKVKAGLTELLTGVDRFVGVELQAEPWFADDISRTDLKVQFELMNSKILVENVQYARKTGLEDHYLWGVEWWYWLAKKHNDWSMWNTAKDLFFGKF
jgi:hypothetical protein